VRQLLRAVARRLKRLAGRAATLHLEPVPSAAEQTRAARESVLVVPARDLAVFVVTGSDRASWLNGLLTCDVTKLVEGAAAYGLAVTQKGRILSDLFVVKRPEAICVALPARSRDAVLEAFDRHLVMEDVEMARADELRVFFAHGPRSAELGGAACDVTGLGGALIVAPAADEARLVRAAADAGGLVGDESGWQALRLERGVPAFGVDFDDTTYPQEASLEKRAVSFDKGCYLGQEVVCMLEMRGHVKRKLVPFVADDGAAIAPGAPVTDDAGADVGKVSSAAASPTLGRTVGLAMVKIASTAPGTELRAGGAKVRVVERPA
jgi:folate-binding protein YgfZ